MNCYPLAIPSVFGEGFSLYEIVCKISEKVKNLETEYANVPELIKSAMQEYIDSGDVDKRISNTLSQFIFVNVKMPPNGVTAAIGDGVTDDTQAVAECVDYVKNGGVVFFPAGIYRLKDVSVDYPNIALIGASANSVSLVFTQNNSYLITLSSNDIVKDITINGKASSSAYNNTAVYIGGDNNVVNADFADCYQCVEIDGVYNNLFANGYDIVGTFVTDNAGNNNLMVDFAIANDVNNDYGIVLNCSGDSVNFTSNKAKAIKASPENYIHCNGSGTIDAQGCYVVNPFGSISITGDDFYKSVTNDNEQITGTKTVNANVVSEQITGAKTVNANTVTEQITGTKSVNANAVTEQITGAKTVNANGIDVTGQVKLLSEPIIYGTLYNDGIYKYINAKSVDNTPYKIYVDNKGDRSYNVNVLDYGAKGDGVTDDTSAIQAAINACPIHGTVYLPFTGNSYITSAQLNVSKPIAIVSNYTGMEFNEHWANVSEAALETPVIKYSGTSYAIQLQAMGFRVENISISATSGGGIIVAPVTGAIVTNPRNNVLRNVTLFSASTITNGLQLSNAFRTIIENVFAYGFRYGFTANGGTSLTFINCWAREFYESAYQISNENYIALVNCCADTESTSANVPYYFETCNNVTLVACGCEGSQRNAFGFNGCLGIYLNGFAVGNNKNATSNGTITFENTSIGCVVGFCDNNNYSGQVNANILIDTNSTCTLVGSRITSGFIRGAYKTISGTFWTTASNPWA